MQAVAQANLIQPRYAVRVRTNDRGIVDVEPVQRGRRPMRWGKQQLCATCRFTGVLGMACTERHAAQIGDPLAATVVVRTKQISRTTAASGSDEAIVSIEPTGQHNRLASQGPLDGIVRKHIGVMGCDACPSGQSPPTNASDLSGRISRSYPAKVVLQFPFEAVLGKTRRTEFQRGSGKHDVRSASRRRLMEPALSNFVSCCASRLHSTSWREDL